MFKRLAVVAPRAVGRVVSPRVSPAISSLQAQPALRLQRRGYHEKDKYFLKFRVPCQGGIGGSSMPRKMLTVPALLDHYNNPRNVGSFGKGEVDVGTGLVGAPACGDVMKLQIRVDKDTNTISDVKFKTFGCGSAIASSSYLTELVRGMTLDEAGKIRNTEIAKELCLPPVKLHCSMLAEDAIKSAISDYYTKNPKAKKTDLSGTSASLPEVEAVAEKAAASA